MALRGTILRLPRAAYTKTPLIRGAVEHLNVKPGIEFNAYVMEDSATPILKTVNSSEHRVLVIAMRAAGESVKNRVLAEYERAIRKMEYENSLWTQEIKGSSTPLVDSGALHSAMRNSKVDIEDDGTTVIAKVSWNIPEDSGFEYLWTHETGAHMRTLKTPDGAILRRDWDLEPRPFFLDAINRAENDARRNAAVIYSPILEILTETPFIKQQKFGVKLFPSMLSTTFTGFVAYFLPPSKLYAYIGAATDISGAFTGNLLSEKQMFGWGRQYAWGQIGATRKTIRRKFRRKLWD